VFAGADEPLQTVRRGGVRAVPGSVLAGRDGRPGRWRARSRDPGPPPPACDSEPTREAAAVHDRRPGVLGGGESSAAAGAMVMLRGEPVDASPLAPGASAGAAARSSPRASPLPDVTASLIVRLGRENPGWGYMRIQEELLGIGVRVSATTVANVLRRYGLGPAPRRIGPTWSQFLRAQAHSLLAGGTDLGLVDGYRDTAGAAVCAEHRAGDPVGAHLNPFPDGPGEAQLVARLVPVPNRVAPPSILIATRGRPCLLLSHRTRARDGPATQPCRHPAPGDQRRRPSWSGPRHHASRNTGLAPHGAHNRQPLASRKRLTRSLTRTSGSSFFTPHASMGPMLLTRC
jgi:hypothetical protein